jgi:hypothetical protein
MATRELSGRKLEEIKEIARGWGKLLAREAYPDGPGLDVSLAEMEEIAATASRGMVEGAVETMTGDQAEQFGLEGPCPTCGKLCKLRRKRRPLVVRGAEAAVDEPVGHCSTCRRDFFPSAAGVENRRPRIQPDHPAPHPPHGQCDQFL